MTEEEYTRKVFESHVGETAGTRSAASVPECPACRPVDDHPQAALQCTRDEGCILKEALAAAPVAASGHVVTFVEHGTHKTIGAVNAPSMSGTIRVSDQATIDYLREAFEKAGWKVEDV